MGPCGASRRQHHRQHRRHHSVGVLIKVLTNNKLKSATHWVVRKPAAHRHSFAFFFNIHGDTWVEPLPEFTDKLARRRATRSTQQLRIRNKTHPPSRPEARGCHPHRPLRHITVTPN